MSSRQEDLSHLKDYINEIDKEVTMILQSLQWDRKHLLQYKPKITCKYDSSHKIPPENLKRHEENCKFKSQGYVEDDVFLPDAFDINSNTYLKLKTEDIKEIINYASKTDPMFMKGDAHVRGQNESEPLTLERLQATYTTNERRAIYDVVINAAPSNQDVSDLALPKADGGPSQSKRKSKQEVLAELRNMRRRRARYRIPGSKNYSHTLRGLIEAQMEMYTEAQNIGKSKFFNDTSEKKYRSDKEDRYKSTKNSEDDRRKHDRVLTMDINNYGFNSSKRSSSERSNVREFENKRYHPIEENSQHNERNGKYEIQRNSHRERDNSKHDKNKNLVTIENYKNRERDRYTSNSRDSYGDNERDERCHSESSERYRVEGKRDDKYIEYDKEKEYSHRHKGDGRYHDKSRERHTIVMKRENGGFNNEYNKYKKYKDYSHRDKRNHR